MTRLPTFSLLLLLNLGLIGWLAAQLTDQSDTRESAWNKTNRGEHGSETVSTTAANTKAIPPTKASSAAARSEKSELSVTPFAQVYSPDPKLFAANLRAAGCPEETIKDILTAEVHRWYQNQEQALRPR